MERDGLAPTLITTTGLQRPKVPQAATDAYVVTQVRTFRSSRIGETGKGEPIPYGHPIADGIQIYHSHLCYIVLALTLPRCKPIPLLTSLKSTPAVKTTGSPRATRVRVVEGCPEENQRKAEEQEAG